MLWGSRRAMAPSAWRTRPVTTIYLDNAATTAIAPTVRTAMAPFLEAEFGNPSTRYAAHLETLFEEIQPPAAEEENPPGER